MVKFIVVGALSALLVAFVPSGRGAAQQAPRVDIRVGVRPDRVRIGDSFVVTVRVVGATWPDRVDLDPGPGAELLDSSDRNSTRVGAGGVTDHVLERDFTLRALVPGSLSLDSVLVDIQGVIASAEIPPVEVVGGGLDWGRAGGSPRSGTRREPEVLGEGVPPRSGGRSYDATQPELSPYGWPGTGLDPRWGTLGVPGGPGLERGVPYGPGVGRYQGGGGYGAAGGYGGYGGYGVYGGYGRLPPGEGWAETAHSDPWWPEMIPELGYYQSLVEDPEGLATLETGLTPERVYVGQQVTLVATATFPPEARYRMGRDPEFFPAAATQAWVVDVPYAPPAPAATGGRLEQAHSFLRAYFPIEPGRLTIDPARLEYSVGAGAARPPLDTLVSDPLSVEVTPIPEEDAPPAWTGAIGRYRISAWLTPQAVGWGESALLMVQISGVGHLPSQPRPDPGPVWGGGLRPMGERAWVEVRDGVVGGIKRFTWLVVPVEEGPVRIGPIFYSFFDPYVGAFGQVISEELVLEVSAYPPDPRSGNAPPVDPSLLGPDAGFYDPYAAPDPGAGSGMGTVRSTSRSAATAAGASAPTMPAPELRTVAAAPDSAFERGVAAMSSGWPEAAARAWVDHLTRHPEDASAWLDLGIAYAQARPGEGWDEWAWRSGLRHSPRDPGLRTAVWGSTSWRPGGGVPLLPLTGREAQLLATLLLSLGLAAAIPGGIGFARGIRSPATRRLLAAGLLSLGLGGVVLSPLQAEATGGAVAVGGVSKLRFAPTGQSSEVSTVRPGTPLSVRERHAPWIRVETTDGASGWVDASRVALVGEPQQAS
jgi:Bacterial SH3 domain